ncbi:MAG: DUF5615 family PIN-like protein [Candidatus Omnitrophica bacterium]|nr:DUF5615 family PIN-like protein [Candidatus Omnitrophota bacterium]
MITILTDQCLHRDIIASLRDSGFNVITAREARLSRALDRVIFDYAQRHNCILLTVDKDFGNILWFDIRHSHGVVLLYVENMTKEQMVSGTLSCFLNLTATKAKGKLFIIELQQIRIWP